MLFVTNLTWNSFTSENSKTLVLCLGNFLLRYVLICNLEVSLNFHLTFLQLNVIIIHSKYFRDSDWLKAHS